MYFVTQFINGLQAGSIYALIALGYTMVYGIIKLINFAHGDIMMVGAYIMLLCVQADIPLMVALLIAMLSCSLLAVILEKLAYKPLRNASRLSALITAIGVSLFLQNMIMLLFKSDPRRFPVSVENYPKIALGGNNFSSMTLGSILAALLIMFFLQIFVKRTKTGKAMRSVSEDMKAAQLMGININKTVSITFAIGSGLAAFAALLYVMAYPQVSPYMGALPGIKAFIAAVLGGIGNIPGAMLGGFVLGIAETLTKAFIPSAYSQLADAVVFVILIVVLLFKPSGIMGRVTKEKV